MQLDLNSGILLIGIVQALFLALSLSLHKKGPVVANRYLAALLLSFAFVLTLQFLSVTGQWRDWVRFYVVSSCCVFLFGPLLYLYIRQLTSPATSVSWAAGLHLLPFIGNLLLIVPLLSLPTGQIIEVIDSGQAASQNNQAGALVLPLLKVVSVTAYTLWSLKLWYAHFIGLKQQFSNLDAISLTWLRNLLIGFLFFELTFFSVLVFNLDTSTIPGNIDSILSFLIVLMIFMTGLYGLQQPEIFRGAGNPEPTESPALPDTNDNAREAKVSVPTNLNDALKAQIQSALTHVMEHDKLYLERFLDLRTLAIKVNVTPHQLSEFLNDVLNVNFYDFINQYRVSEAKEKLQNTDAAILDIALEAGFNNKATFNKAFKKYTDMTPSQFRKDIGSTS